MHCQHGTPLAKGYIVGAECQPTFGEMGAPLPKPDATQDTWLA